MGATEKRSGRSAFCSFNDMTIILDNGMDEPNASSYAIRVSSSSCCSIMQRSGRSGRQCISAAKNLKKTMMGYQTDKRDDHRDEET